MRLLVAGNGGYRLYRDARAGLLLAVAGCRPRPRPRPGKNLVSAPALATTSHQPRPQQRQLSQHKQSRDIRAGNEPS